MFRCSRHYVVGISIALASCTTTGPKQNVGAGLGALTGAVIGSQFGGGSGERVAGALIGAVGGGLIGGAIGAELDAQDRQRLDEITLVSLQTGSTKSFRSSRTGVRAKTRVVASTRRGEQPCRTVEQEVILASGERTSTSVQGCKGPSGWAV